MQLNIDHSDQPWGGEREGGGEGRSGRRGGGEEGRRGGGEEGRRGRGVEEAILRNDLRQ